AVMSKAKGALELLSAEPSAQELARQRELAEFTWEHSLAVAREEARAEGAAEGEARGKADGEARGKAEGKAESKAEAILSVLAARGLLVPEPVAAEVRRCRDWEQLEAWLCRAVVVGSAGELLA
ncbi:MAG: hypothetical protein HY744_20130, partial [Deltaproteobacteria bacterium]|nr:hypothetical protein [Deltaproteobacteria bacterium]